MKGLDSEKRTAQKVPIEGLKVATIKDDSVALGNRPFVKGIGSYEMEEFVGPETSFGQTSQEVMLGFGVVLSSEHAWPPI
jgi:hypothetical protein